MMAGPSTAAASADETRRTVSEFFVKSLNVILGARIPAKHLTTKNAGVVNRCFNMVLDNSPLQNRCHLSTLEPIVVDVILHRKSSRPVEQQQQQQQKSLIERWVVHCVPWSEDNARRTNEDRGRHRAVCVRMLTIMLRTLYSVTRLLPAYRLFQTVNSDSGSDCSNFELLYKVSTTLESFENEASLNFRKLVLTPVETDLGRMSISVKYSDSETVLQATERTDFIVTNIIPDYVPVNPHYAVINRTVSRTKSNDVPRPPVSKDFRRSRSSPYLNDDIDQLNCPFALDDEPERKNEAQVGDLIRTLKAARPLEKVKHMRQRTLRQALEELAECKIKMALAYLQTEPEPDN